MKLNHYVKQWVDETYELSNEKFYLNNAEFTLIAERFFGGCKIIAFQIIATPVLFLVFNNRLTQIGMFYTSVIVSFLLYAMKKYGEHDSVSATFMGIFSYIMLMWLQNQSTIFVVCTLAAVPLICLYFVKIAIKYFRLRNELKEFFISMENDEWTAYKEAYRQKYNEAKNGKTNDNPGDEKLEDPIFSLFDGYDTSAMTLKKRYRELAKKEHPDMGGDAEKFKRIVSAYTAIKEANGW